MASALFADKLVDDDREPFLDFEIPGVEGMFGVLAPKLQFWNDLLLILLGQTVLMCSFSVLIFKLVVKHRGSTGSYLFGYGVIIPVAMWVPYPLLEFLDLQNRVLKMSAATLPTVVAFRCIEAMHGTSPHSVETSMGHYAAYYSSVMEFVWDEKTTRRVRISGTQLLVNMWRIVAHFIAVSLVLSYLLAYDFKPFASNVVLNEFHLTPELFYPGQLANNYLAAVLTYLTLSVGFNLTAFGENAKGLLTHDIFRNPLFSSSCPTDFWGRKWNLVIHKILKRGAFLPAKKYFSTPVAVLVCFVASGILHDYTWTLIFYNQQRTIDAGCLNCFFPIFFKQTVFFLYCGLTMLLERPVGRLPGVRWLVPKLPVPVVSTCVVMTAIPFAHFYHGDWIVGGLFEHFTLGLLRVVRLS